MANIFRNIPSVNQLLESPQLKKMVEKVNHQVVVDGVRTFIDDLKEKVQSAAEDIDIPSPAEMAERIADWLADEDRPVLRPVINGTGILLHTGLGRAPLCKTAIEEIESMAAGYASVEIDLQTGQRSQRVSAVERIICELTGAEAAVVVNNNAAATMITLGSMAGGQEVIVSRGQLIEIGGSYRLPEVMECSGCTLKEVGATNKTRAADYENAINEQTGALLKVHPSNFEIVGFTATVPIEEMVAIGRKHNVPVIDDVGSGALIDFGRYGLGNEPVVRQSIDAGADVVLFSGDKLIGGPQCGIIIGKKVYIDAILKNPLMRAMRVDKITLAALNATLKKYRNVESAEQEIPLLTMLSTPVANLKMRAEKIAAQVSGVGGVGQCEVIESQAMLGGGSLPTQELPSYCVTVPVDGKTANWIAGRLREAEPAIMGRVQKDKFMIDLRAVFPAQDSQLVSVLESFAAGDGAKEEAREEAKE